VGKFTRPNGLGKVTHYGLQSSEVGHDRARNYRSDRLMEVTLLGVRHFKPHPGYFFMRFNMRHTEIFLAHRPANERFYKRKTENYTVN